jgi:hypothetical protein
MTDLGDDVKVICGETATGFDLEYRADGTSFSTPFVSAKLGWIQDEAKQGGGSYLTEDELTEKVFSMCNDLGTPGIDPYTGRGFLQLVATEYGRKEEPTLKTLRKGDKGADVKRMQERLLVHGQKLPNFGVDSDFGEETEKALVAFKTAKGLPDPKICDERTWMELMKEPASPEPKPEPTNRIKRFILWLRTLVNKAIYVWGAQGQHGNEIAEEWIRRRETSTKNANRAIALWKKRIAEGIKDIFAFDCSGMIVFWLMLMGIFKSDMS